jgi:hypothetical protein
VIHGDSEIGSRLRRNLIAAKTAALLRERSTTEKPRGQPLNEKRRRRGAALPAG